MGGVLTLLPCRKAAGLRKFPFGENTLIHILIDDFIGGNPRHHLAEFSADLLNLMGCHIAAARGHAWIAKRAFLDEGFGVVTILDVFQRRAHRFARAVIDDRFACDIFAIFGVIGNGVIHIGNAAFIDQVNDKLCFVQALKIS